MGTAFQYPDHWWWLLAVLPVLVFAIIYLFWHARTIKALADAHLLKQLLTHYSASAKWVRYGCIVLALALLALSMMNLQQPDEKAGAAVSGLDLMLVVDVSNSMLATDVQPSRLEHARKLALTIADSLKGSRIGVVAFAGDANLQLPLTNDMGAVSNLLKGLNADAITLEGTNMGAALDEAANGMGMSDPKYKAIVLLTDGESLEGETGPPIQQLREMGGLLLVAGIGTPQGSLVRDAAGMEILKEDGARVISRLDEKLLKQLAAQTNGVYVPWAAPDVQSAALFEELKALPSRPLVNSFLVNYYSFSHLMIGAALLLLLLPFLLQMLAGKKKVRVAALSLLIVSLLIAPHTKSQDAEAAFAKADEYYRKGELAKAGQAYEAGLKTQPNHWRAYLQLGNIAFRKTDYQSSLKQYALAAQWARRPEHKAWAENNIGLAMARLQKPAAAVEKFQASIRLSPGDTEVLQNLQQAMAELAEQQKKKPIPNSPKAQNLENKLKALQEEEKRVREKLQKRNPKTNNGKNW
jgi:Ca-activated chloride channel family protein